MNGSYLTILVTIIIITEVSSLFKYFDRIRRTQLMEHFGENNYKTTTSNILNRSKILQTVSDEDILYNKVEGIIAKTIVWCLKDGSSPFLVVLASDRKISPSKLQNAIFLKNIRMTTVQEAENLTGQKVGSISPIGHSAMPVYIDLSLQNALKEDSSSLFVGCGIVDMHYKLSVDEFFKETKAKTVDISSITLENAAKSESAGQSRCISEDKAKNRITRTNSVLFRPSLFRKAAIAGDNDLLLNLINAATEGKFCTQYLPFNDGRALSDHFNIPSTLGGKTALHMAAWKAPIATIHLLIENGASINQYSTNIGNYGKTAIFYAITQSRDEVVMTLLRDYHAFVRIVNNKGQTPLSIAVSHLKEETIMAIEAAEEEQQGMNDGKFWNFYESHGMGVEGVFGDLDPRFAKEAAELRVEYAIKGMTLPRSIKPTTAESRNSSKSRLSSVSCGQTLDLAEVLQSSNSRDVQISETTGTVELVGRVISKRQMSKYLVFVNIAPLLEESASKDGFGDENHRWRKNGVEGFSVQLIFGKTLRENTSEDFLRKTCKYLKEGQAIRIDGVIRGVVSQSHQGANGGEIDVAVARVDFIATGGDFVACDSFAESFSISSAPSATTGSLLVTDYQAKEVVDSCSSTAEDKTTDGNKSKPKDNANRTEVINSKEISVEDIPLFSLEDITHWHSTAASTFSAMGLRQSIEGFPVLLVDGREALSGFSFIVDKIVREDLLHETEPCSVGMDCEWRPFQSSGSSSSVSPSGASPRSSFSEQSHALVETLQLSTKRGVFILDMTSLTALSLEAVHQLDSSLAKLFQNENIWKLGYDVRNDVDRLAASFPQLNSLKRVLSIIDLNPLARCLYPGRVLKRSPGLSKLSITLCDKRLDKSQQCSPWHRRPFTERQLKYASLDAAILIHLFDIMCGQMRSRVNNPLDTVEAMQRYLQKQGLLFHIKYKITSLPATDTASSTAATAAAAAAAETKGKKGCKEIFGRQLYSKTWFNLVKEPSFDEIEKKSSSSSAGFKREKNSADRLSLQSVSSESSIESYRDPVTPLLELVGQIVGKNKNDCIKCVIDDEFLSKSNNKAPPKYRDCGGYGSIDDSVFILFMQTLRDGEESSSKKYANTFDNAGETFSYFIPHHDVSRVLGDFLQCKKSYNDGGDTLNGSEPSLPALADLSLSTRSPRFHLFIHNKRRPFLYCGAATPVSILSQSSRQRFAVVLFKLLQFKPILELSEEFKESVRWDLNVNSEDMLTSADDVSTLTTS